MVPADILEQAALEQAHHEDNQRRFMSVETMLRDNSELTKKTAEKVECLTDDVSALKKDTSELVEMWKDAGVVFKWLRRLGALLVWVRNVALAAVAIYVLWRYGPTGPPK